jgi:hypothetical protein
VTATPTNPPNNNRGLLIAIFVLGGILLAALALLAGILVSRGSSSNVSSGPSSTLASGGTSSSSSSSSTSSSTSSTSTSTTTSTSTSTLTTTTTTAAPTSTSSSTVAGGLTQSCTTDVAHARIHYPSGWYTSDGEVECLLFDPHPITVIPDSEQPFTAVYVSYRDTDLATSVVQERSPDFVTLEDEQTTTLGGRSAVCLTMTSNGEGLLEAGTRLYVCLVDFAGHTLVVGSNRPPDAPDQDYDATVRAMAAAATPI